MNKIFNWLRNISSLFVNFPNTVDQTKPNPPQSHNSKISNPELISSAAIVENSILSGPIRIAARAKLIKVWLQGEIVIGKFSSLNGPNTNIFSLHNPVLIGNFCSIAGGVTIQEYNHSFERCSSYFMNQNVFGGSYKEDTYSKGPIKIGHDVWIGAQSIILSGVSIGDGAIIGANSVVTSSIPPYAIAIGSPARVIRYRFDQEIIESLLEQQWWLWSQEKIMRNRNLFQGTLTLDKIAKIE